MGIAEKFENWLTGKNDTEPQNTEPQNTEPQNSEPQNLEPSETEQLKTKLSELTKFMEALDKDMTAKDSKITELEKELASRIKNGAILESEMLRNNPQEHEKTPEQIAQEYINSPESLTSRYMERFKMEEKTNEL